MKLTTPIVSGVIAGLLRVAPGTTGADVGAAACVRPSTVQRLVFSARKYPHIRRHVLGAVRSDWPRRLVLN